MRRGIVADFDEAKGFGAVTAGDDRFFFHCTQIADGTRTIATGTEVTFDVIAGHMGMWEAAAVTAVPILPGRVSPPSPPR